MFAVISFSNNCHMVPNYVLVQSLLTSTEIPIGHIASKAACSFWWTLAYFGLLCVDSTL